jgi:SAM-dependent methyltransferase
MLDLGCSGGQLAERLQEAGHHVTGVDVTEIDKVRDRTGAFYRADLNDGIPAEVGSGFDIVIAADVLEHLSDPGRLLNEIQRVLSPNGSVIACVPNISHWYPRFRIMAGLFDYDQRGILDRTHMRFFTRRSFRRLVESQGFRVRRIEAVGLPMDALNLKGGASRFLRFFDHMLVGLWPTMFGYQFIIEATRSDKSVT